MANDITNVESSSEGTTTIMNGSVKIDGNLEVGQELLVNDFKVVEDGSTTPMLYTKGGSISFNKVCKFNKGAEFNVGRTVIGLETTYKSAYVGTESLQAGQRLVVGDSSFKITADDREIIADTYAMSLKGLIVDSISTKKINSKIANVGTLEVIDELMTNKL